MPARINKYGMLIKRCESCGSYDASWGFGVNIMAGKMGKWFCWPCVKAGKHLAKTEEIGSDIAVAKTESAKLQKPAKPRAKKEISDCIPGLFDTVSERK